MDKEQMQDVFEICGVQIPLKEIKEYRIEYCEYIYRAAYRETNYVPGQGYYQFVQMFPYAAVLGESGHVATGVVYKVADKLNIKALKTKKFRCRKITGSEFDLYLEDVPLLLFWKTGGESDVYLHDEIYERIKNPVVPILETVLTLFIRAKKNYVFYGNGIQVADAEEEYERLKSQLLQRENVRKKAKDEFFERIKQAESAGRASLPKTGAAVTGIAKTVFSTASHSIDKLHTAAEKKKK